eukprot:12414210-Alexandrium_andersonii.AAC.1
MCGAQGARLAWRLRLQTPSFGVCRPPWNQRVGRSLHDTAGDTCTGSLVGRRSLTIGELRSSSSP